MAVCRPITILAIACVLAAGCSVAHPTAPVKKGTATPLGVTALASVAPLATLASITVPQIGITTTLTGKVKLLSDQGGGIISNNTGNIISDNGGGLVSNNSGNIISDNGGGLIGNNSAGVVSGHGAHFAVQSYDLLSATSSREASLAAAVITVTNAAGAPLVDEHGKPLTATTDNQGNYKFSAVFPPQNLILHVKLFPSQKTGGELSAVLARQDGKSRQQVIDTASSLGAAYVLGQYVTGDQTRFDRLPVDQANRLQRELQPARVVLSKAPRYQPTELVGLTEDLRKKLPGADQALTDIKAILLGQASLGNGHRATEVPLQGPRSLTRDSKGNIYIAEDGLGRIRKVAPDGTMTTYADAVFGDVKRNFAGLHDLATAPDGTLIVSAFNQIFHIGADGAITTIAGNGTNTHVTSDGPAEATSIVPGALAAATDGTVYTVEYLFGANAEDKNSPVRLIAMKDGQVHRVALDAAYAFGDVAGICAGPDGTIDMLIDNSVPANNLYTLLRIHADGHATVLANHITGGVNIGLCRGVDDTHYLSLEQSVVAIAADGTQHAIAGVGGPAGSPALSRIKSALVGPDGTLYVADHGASLIRAMAPDGTWRVFAGLESSSQTGNGGDIAINAPAGLAVDGQGALLISEGGSHTVKRYDGKTLTTAIGTTQGGSGDEGPADKAQLSQPTCIQVADGTTYILDTGNRRLRSVGSDGVIHSLVGTPDGVIADNAALVSKDHPVDAKTWPVHYAGGLAISPTHRIYWTDYTANRVLRLSLDGKQVELVAGAPGSLPGFPRGDGGPAIDATLTLPYGLAFDAKGDLYVADTGNGHIRKITGLDGPTPMIDVVAGMSLPETLAAIASGASLDEDGIDAHKAILSTPVALCTDAAGNVYVAEGGTVNINRLSATFSASNPFASAGIPDFFARIRKITPQGKISTIAGSGGLFFSDPHGADALVLPAAMAIDAKGRLAICDLGANQIRFLPAGSY